MDDTKFEELLSSVKDMGKHMRGEKIAGALLALHTLNLAIS